MQAGHLVPLRCAGFPGASGRSQPFLNHHVREQVKGDMAFHDVMMSHDG